MSNSNRVLVLLHEASAAQQAARLQGAYRVIVLLRPRVLVLQLDDEALAEVSRDPDIAGVYEREVPPEIVARLRPDERLFVEAWIQQQASGDKRRPGEGLSWDAPGFQPPDAPPGSGGYCVFFVKGYPVDHFAYASIGGPRIVMEYANDGWGPDNIDRVFAHESGHIFRAPDEYASSGCNCGGTWGRFDEPNANCENCAGAAGVACLMRANT